MNIHELLPDYREYLEHERFAAKMTVIAYINDLEMFAQFTTKEVADIALDDLREYMRYLSKIGQKAATIRRKMHGFTTFWQWLKLTKNAVEVITEGLTLPRRAQDVPRWMTEDELRIFINTPICRRGIKQSRRDALAFKTMAWLGLRRSEILNLKVGDLLFDDKRIIIRKAKGNKDRTLPLPAPLAVELQDYIGGQPKDNYVFCGHRGGQWSTASFAKAFRLHIRTCGLDDDLHPHSVRHGFGTTMVAQGVNPFALKTLMGHEDIKTTMRYVHITHRDLATAMDKHILNSLVKQESEPG